jgi:anti-sigma factor RsiW
MNVTRDVVRDLVTLYLAGEASADTRLLVEEYLSSNPAFAREVEAARTDDLRVPPVPLLPAESGKLALDRTRQLLRNRTSTLVVAILFTALPLAFAFNAHGITFLLIRDAPVVGASWWLTAVVMWVWHARIRRRLRVSGL